VLEISVLSPKKLFSDGTYNMACVGNRRKKVLAELVLGLLFYTTRREGINDRVVYVRLHSKIGNFDLLYGKI